MSFEDVPKSVQTLDDGVIENVPILDDVSDDFAIRIPLTHAFFSTIKSPILQGICFLS